MILVNQSDDFPVMVRMTGSSVGRVVGSRYKVPLSLWDCNVMIIIITIIDYICTKHFCDSS